MCAFYLSRARSVHTHLCVILRLTCPTAVQAAEIGKVLLEKNNQLEEDNELLANDMVALRQQLVETQHELSIAQAAKAQLSERNQGLQQDNLRLSRAAQMVCVVWRAPSEPSPSHSYTPYSHVCVCCHYQAERGQGAAAAPVTPRHSTRHQRSGSRGETPSPLSHAHGLQMQLNETTSASMHSRMSTCLPRPPNPRSNTRATLVQNALRRCRSCLQRASRSCHSVSERWRSCTSRGV